MKKDFTDIKVVGFDLDQTLYPKSPEIDLAIQGYLYQKIAEQHHTSIDEAGVRFRAIYQEGRGLSGSNTLIALGLGMDKSRMFVQEALEKADIANYLKPNQKTTSLLSKIRLKFKNCDILTGSNRSITEKKLAKLGISKRVFTNILTADDGSKSDGKLYKLWLKIYPSFNESNFLYIGDRAYLDFEVPSKLGIKSILVNIKKPDRSLACLQLATIHDLIPLLFRNKT